MKKYSLFNIINNIFFTLMAIITLYPLWHTFIGSIIPYHEFAQKTILLFPNNISFEAYKVILTKRVIPQAFKISTFVTVLGTFLSLLFSTIAGYILSKKNLPGRNLMFLFVLIPMLFSGGLIPLYISLNKYKLIDSIWVYILPSLISTYYVIILKTSFQEFPESLESSAKIDGCSEIGILFRIVVPASFPVLSTIGLFYAVARWNELFAAIFFIMDAKKLNLQVILYNIVASVDHSTENVAGEADRAMVSEQIKYGTIIVATIPILLVYPFLQKYFIKGVLIGAIKG